MKQQLPTDEKKTSQINVRMSDTAMDKVSQIRLQLFYESHLTYSYAEIIRMALDRFYNQIIK